MLEVNTSFLELGYYLLSAKSTFVFIEVDILLFVSNTTVVKTYLMIASDNYFVFEVEFLYEFEEFPKVMFFSIIGKISSMNKDISFELEQFT